LGTTTIDALLLDSEEALFVMNIEWDYGYYQLWSDNKWLVDEMMALLNENITIQ